MRATFYAVFMLGCTGALALDKVAPEPLSADAIELNHKGVCAKLKDPDAAKVGTIIAGRNKKGVLQICGWVNCKNAFGAYTGMQPFTGMMMEQPGNKMLGFYVNEIGSEVVLSWCKDIGLQL